MYDEDAEVDILVVLEGSDGTGRRAWSVDVRSDRGIGGGISSLGVKNEERGWEIS